MSDSVTIPVVRAEGAVLAPIVADRTVRPAYVWKTGKTFFLSRKQQVVADTFLETRSYAECSRRLREIGIKRSWLTCQRWLEMDHVKQYIAEQLEERGVYAGWTKERWMLIMTKHIQEEKRLAAGDLYAMKLIAGVKGWDAPAGGMQLNQQINITQANGRE